MPASLVIPRPSAGEHSEEVGRYLSEVPGEDALPALVAQVAEVDRVLGPLSEERALHRYAPGKWSVKEVLGHLTDAERICAYRALRFAREDATPLPGFEENLYVPAGRFDARPVAELVDGWRVVRAATLALFRGLDEEALLRRGVANDRPTSVRTLAWLAVAHAAHHLRVLRERYGVR